VLINALSTEAASHNRFGYGARRSLGLHSSLATPQRAPCNLGRKIATDGALAPVHQSASRDQTDDPFYVPSVPFALAEAHHAIVITLEQRTIVLCVTRPATQNSAARDRSKLTDAPAVGPEIIARSPNALYFRVEDERLAEWFEMHRGSSSSCEIELLPPAAPPDPVIEELARMLLNPADVGEGCGELFSGAVAAAILMRLIGLHFTPVLPAPRAKTSALPKWRLKRVIDYIDANLSETITLSGLAAVTGLTRMHFAAQFRSATGMRPHEYLLRRRIERAQTMLSASNARLVDVALSVGFQTQAHFTTVFKRFAGATPHQWRREHDQPTSDEAAEATAALALASSLREAVPAAARAASLRHGRF
jgi:AraC family transcriptional regulator